MISCENSDHCKRISRKYNLIYLWPKKMNGEFFTTCKTFSLLNSVDIDWNIDYRKNFQISCSYCPAYVYQMGLFKRVVILFVHNFINLVRFFYSKDRVECFISLESVFITARIYYNFKMIEIVTGKNKQFYLIKLN